MITAESVGDDKAQEKLKKIQAGLTPEKTDHLLASEASQAFGELVGATPKKWFGQVRDAWQIEHPQLGEYNIVNRNKIMFWLEKGTKAHGPVRAKALFIPLTLKAATATFETFAVGRASYTVPGEGGKKIRRNGRVMFLKERKKVTRLIFGVDYILVKKVKGITPRNIVAKQQAITDDRMLKRFKAYLREILQS